MVHQSLPSLESMPPHMQRKPFLQANAPQIDNLKAQEMSAMTIHLIFFLPDILLHIWHHTNVCLANTYIRHHPGALSAWRIITS